MSKYAPPTNDISIWLEQEGISMIFWGILFDSEALLIAALHEHPALHNTNINACYAKYYIKIWKFIYKRSFLPLKDFSTVAQALSEN